MKILIVEDEKLLASAISRGLKKLGYAIDIAADGAQALELAEINHYDLMLLDLNLPKISGLDVLKTLRKNKSSLKILILSAKSQSTDKICGLNLGANDYLEKPFDFGELAARINNLIRWDFDMRESLIQCRNLCVNTLAKSVTIGNSIIGLTRKEYGIIEYLAYNRGRVVSAEEIIEHVWDSDVDLFSSTFKFHMHSLKKKLPEDNIIRNIRGQGYIICAEDKDD